MSSLHLMSPGGNVKVIHAQSADSAQRALLDCENERVQTLAGIVSAMHGYHPLELQDEHIKKHFIYWAWVFYKGAALSADQFRLFPLAVHHAAQSGIDCYYERERCELINLLDPRYVAERKDWNEIAQKIILAYRDVLGDPLKAELVRRLYQMEQEATSGDPRRI